MCVRGTENSSYKVGCLSVRTHKRLAMLTRVQEGSPLFVYSILLKTSSIVCLWRNKGKGGNMDFMQRLEIGALLGATVAAIWGAALAGRRNRGSVKWFFICWMTGLVGLITLAVSKTLVYNEEEDFHETDTLGNVMIFIGLGWTVLLSWLWR